MEFYTSDLYGEDIERDYGWCRVCGARIEEPDIHKEWHQNLGK